MKMRTPAAIAALVALAGLAPQRADANVTEAQWSSSTQFSYRVIFVPDFDQRRSNVPEDGSNYCVPTSFMNWAAYIARRGNPNQAPGGPPWGFNQISGNLILLGVLMNTDPNGGTGPTGGTAGGSAWLAPRAFVFATTGNTSAGFPRLSTLSSQAINSGALIIPRVGWYTIANFPFISRQGGHAVSMVKAQRSGSSQLIGINDPAWSPSGDTLGVQSQFTMNQYQVQDVVVFPDGNAPALMSRINGYGSSTRTGFIYGNYTIIPLVALAPVQFNLRIHRINLSIPNTTEQQTIANPSGLRIRRGMYGMNPSQIFYAADSAASAQVGLFMYSMEDDSHTPLVQVDGPFRGMTTSRFDRSYLLANGRLYCLNPNADPGEYVEAEIPVPPESASVAFSDMHDEVVVLESRARQLLRYPADLPAGVPPVAQDIPAGVSVGPDATIDIRPGDGSVLIASGVTTSVALLLPAVQAGDEIFDVEFINPPGNDPATGASFTDEGVMVVTGGVGYEMMRDPDTQRWIVMEDSPFNGLAMDGPVFAGRSRTDVDRKTEFDPANADTLPDDFSGSEDFVSCPADVNGDGVVNFVDLNAVLTSFGQTGLNLPGDTDGDGDVDFTDLNNVLSNFGVDCG
jgi:hypothetical protein